MPTQNRAKSPFLAQWLILVIALVMLGCAIGYDLYQYRARVQEREQDRLVALTRVIEINLQQDLQAIAKVLTAVRDDVVPAVDYQALSARIDTLSTAMPSIRAVNVYDSSGTVRASNHPHLIGQNENFVERDYFRVPKQAPDIHTLYVSPPFRTTQGAYTVALSKVILNASGAFAGVVIATLDTTYLYPLLDSVLYSPDMLSSFQHGDGTVFLAAPQGGSNSVGKNLAKPGSFFMQHKDSGQPATVFSGAVLATGEERMIAQRDIRPGNLNMDKSLAVAVSRRSSEIYAPWYRDAYLESGLFALMASAFCMGLSFYQRRYRQFLHHDEIAALKLAQSESRLRAILETSPACVKLMSKDGSLLSMNSAGLRMIEADSAELVEGKSVYSTVAPADRAAFQKFNEWICDGNEGTLEFEIIGLKGTRRWMETWAVPFHLQPDGSVVQLSVTHDISERKQSEVALRLQQEIVANAAGAIALIEASGSTILYVNRAFQTLFGYSEGELMGQSISIVNAHSDRSPLEKMTEINQQLLDYGFYRGEIRSQSKDGAQILTYANISSFHHPQLGVLWITHQSDLTQVKAAQAAIDERESQYRIAIETAANGFWLTDMYGQLIQVNDAYAHLSGYSQAELTGMNITELEAQEHPDDTRAHIERVIAGGHDRFESVHRKKNGTLWPVEVVVSYSPMLGGRAFVFLIDLTQRKKTEERLQLAAIVFNNSTEGMMVADADNTIISVNAAFTQLTGYSAEEAIGQTPRILNSGRHDKAFYQSMWQELIATGKWQGEIWERRKNGEAYPKLLTINTVFNEDRTVHRRVAMFFDISEKKKSEEVIWRQANFDSLTELPNRRMFMDRLQQEVKKSHRAELPLALMFLDLDRFKEINDTLGHDIGDLLLIETAKRLKSCVREVDTVARLGGDEFTIILGELDAVNRAERIAQDILRKIATPFYLKNEVVYMTTSIGITFSPNDADDADVLMKNADQAMYAAKSQGRNRYGYFTASMQETAQTRLRLANDLRNALAENQFRVFYQPIVELATGSIHKAEALIRWQHPTRGLVSPADFIPIAEDTGMIVDIGDWVFYEAVRQVQKWRTALHPSFQISVNKSPVQFRSDGNSHGPWVDHLRGLVLPGQCIAVEITEGLLMDAGTTVSNHLLGFRDAGVQVSLDDFGTGYSSLSYLKKFDIDFLKIDQSFVQHLKPNSEDLALCEAIIVMAHKLGIKVVAEGVETQEQRDLLAAAGCDYAQGYLYSRPIPAAEFEALLEKGFVC